MNPFEAQMNKAFQKLAVDIIPSDDQLKKAKIYADKVSYIIYSRISLAINTNLFNNLIK